MTAPPADDAARTRPTPLVVTILGMHRSGTSVAGALVESLGVSMGDRAKHLRPLDENPRGFWEHAGVRDLNEELLHRLHGSWHAPPPLPRGWHSAPGLADLRDRTAAFIETEFGGHARWGWKDPRACVLLPFWSALLPPQRHIVCVRNPLDVVQSLQQRDDLTFDDGVRLWLVSMAGAVLHTTGQPRRVVHYESMIASPDSVIAQVLPLLDGVSRQADTAPVVDPGLRHHRTTPEQALHDARLPRPVRDLYAACVRADEGAALDLAASDAVHAQLVLDQAAGLSTWFTRFARAQATALDPADVHFGRPRPVSAARQQARAFFEARPALASSYRDLRRVVRRTLGLGP